MALDVLRVQSRRDLSRFIDVPWQVYDRTLHKAWVPPLRLMVQDALDTKKNPFYRTAEIESWIALRDGKPVAWLAAIANHAHNEFHGDRTGFFGFFEAKDDQEATNALVDLGADWLRTKGLTSIQGPMSPSTNYECGLLVDGFEHHPMLLTTWNPPYYDKLLSNAGLRGVKDLLGFWIPADDPDWKLPERYAEHAQRVMERGKISFREVDLKQFEREVGICWEIYNAAWEKNWGFVPMSRDEFWHMAKDMKYLVTPELVFIAEVDGDPAGFVLVAPDLNEVLKRIPSGKLLPTGLFKRLAGKGKVRNARVLALGVKEKYRIRGIYQLFAHELVRRGRIWGATGGEASWILEDNDAMVRPLETMGARPYRRWRIYERPIAEAR